MPPPPPQPPIGQSRFILILVASDGLYYIHTAFQVPNYTLNFHLANRISKLAGTSKKFFLCSHEKHRAGFKPSLFHELSTKLRHYQQSCPAWILPLNFCWMLNVAKI